MKERNNLFEEILSWAYDKKVSGYLEEDLKKELCLTSEEFNWYVKMFRSNMPIIDNLVIYTEYKDNKHIYTLSAKGISKYLELKKSWHEKLLGKIVIASIIAIISFIIGRFGDSIYNYFSRI